MSKKKYIGIDLFSGAGGMSIGAIDAGVDVKIAVEIDKYAAETFTKNHPGIRMFNQDIRRFKVNGHLNNKVKDWKIVFGGPPCQGFSTANQKTRNRQNVNNWLFKDFIRITKEVKPDWVVVENVKGLIETENGYFLEQILKRLRKEGYKTNFSVLNACDYGVPQSRGRIFIVGSLHGVEFKFPQPTNTKHLTVKDAISDLPFLSNGANIIELEYKSKTLSDYQRTIRKQSKKSVNNLVTDNNELVIERYKHIPQGCNWESIPKRLMKNYKDFSRCHTRIYHRLVEDKPSVVLGNYRKNMLIHPIEDRGLSVREAARLQSFPDTFHFYGSIGFQQQQVGNSVPPLLAKEIFKKVLSYR